MLIFDQLRKNDPQLQLLAVGLGVGLFVLLTGLWWVQIVNSNRHQQSVETQSFRSVRIPATRGQIYDRNGVALAENRPSYNINLYLEELSRAFRKEYQRLRPRTITTNDLPFWKDWLGLPAIKTNFPPVKGDQLERTARWQIVTGVANQVANILHVPLAIDPTNFHKHYVNYPFVPFSLAENLSPQFVARFEEHPLDLRGINLEIQSRRHYPHGTVAAHVIGYVRTDNSSVKGEESFYWYRHPDYQGRVGIEGGLDATLRGHAGYKSVQINNLGYRQTENTWEPTLPGTNVILTLDLELQRAAEAALRRENAFTRGAVVVMDVRSGDLLALASNPTYSPNQFAHGISSREYQEIQALSAEKNRATAEHYQAGSIFKTIVALAALETPHAFDPKAQYVVKPHPYRAGYGAIYVGRQLFQDTVPPGEYNLHRAIVRSSNAYFIDLGLRPGVFEHVIELGRRLHLGERFPPGVLPLRQETGGNFPTAEQVRRNWPDGQTANICIGQGKMDVTPLQVAVLTAALANGGNVLLPRLIHQFIPNDSTGLTPPVITPSRQIRNQLGVSKRSLELLREAMLAETEDESEGGTGTRVRGSGYRVCGKTGTAELDILRPDGRKKNTTWFASYAPYEAPRYAVVVMVEDGISGGTTCAPIAKDVYVALKSFESRSLTNNAIAGVRR